MLDAQRDDNMALQEGGEERKGTSAPQEASEEIDRDETAEAEARPNEEKSGEEFEGSDSPGDLRETQHGEAQPKEDKSEEESKGSGSAGLDEAHDEEAELEGEESEEEEKAGNGIEEEDTYIAPPRRRVLTTPLHEETAKGNYELVKSLLEACLNADTKDEWGETALHVAVQRGHVEIVKLLTLACPRQTFKIGGAAKAEEDEDEDEDENDEEETQEEEEEEDHIEIDYPGQSSSAAAAAAASAPSTPELRQSSVSAEPDLLAVPLPELEESLMAICENPGCEGRKDRRSASSKAKLHCRLGVLPDATDVRFGLDLDWDSVVVVFACLQDIRDYNSELDKQRHGARHPDWARACVGIFCKVCSGNVDTLYAEDTEAAWCTKIRKLYRKNTQRLKPQADPPEPKPIATDNDEERAVLDDAKVLTECSAVFPGSDLLTSRVLRTIERSLRITQPMKNKLDKKSVEARVQLGDEQMTCIVVGLGWTGFGELTGVLRVWPVGFSSPHHHQNIASSVKVLHGTLSKTSSAKEPSRSKDDDADQLELPHDMTSEIVLQEGMSTWLDPSNLTHSLKCLEECPLGFAISLHMYITSEFLASTLDEPKGERGKAQQKVESGYGCLDYFWNLDLPEDDPRLLEIKLLKSVADFSREILGSEGRSAARARDDNGWTAFHLACSKGNLEIVKILREVGAKLEARTTEDLTALHLAAADGHVRVVENLTKAKSNIEAIDEEGNTALHWAAGRGHLEIIKHLVEVRHCNVEPKDRHGNTPLHRAQRFNRVRAVELLQTLALQQAAAKLSKGKEESSKKDPASLDGPLYVPLGLHLQEPTKKIGKEEEQKEKEDQQQGGGGGGGELLQQQQQQQPQQQQQHPPHTTTPTPLLPPPPPLLPPLLLQHHQHQPPAPGPPPGLQMAGAADFQQFPVPLVDFSGAAWGELPSAGGMPICYPAIPTQPPPSPPPAFEQVVEDEKDESVQPQALVTSNKKGCLDFAKKGKCRKGAQCPYSHAEEDILSRVVGKPKAQRLSIQKQDREHEARAKAEAS